MPNKLTYDAVFEYFNSVGCKLILSEKQFLERMFSSLKIRPDGVVVNISALGI